MGKMAAIAPVPCRLLGKRQKRDTLGLSMRGLLVCVLFFGCAGRPMTGSHNDAGADLAGSGPGSWTVPTDAGTVVYNLRDPIRPVPKLDLVFVLDTSPSMAAKQQKFATGFPKLITDLTNPCTREMPDLRVAIVTSDMGTGGISSTGFCGHRADGSIWGDRGRFQFANAAACGVTDTSQPWLFENRNADPVRKNFAGDFSTVFGCLASAVGTGGCGYNQPLRALESAFFDPSNAKLQRDLFLRPDAYLWIFIITDQDDCSAGSKSGIFADVPAAAGESASLRCTTRATTCNGQNLSILPPGYPTMAAFAANFTACTTRTDFCGPTVDATQPTDCNPLEDYRVIANEIKQLKASPNDSILVTGIFGWPADVDIAKAQLIVDQRPNPDGTDNPHPQIFDAWPICYDPGHPPANQAGGFDPEAAAWGGSAGLRISAFLDEFSPNGIKSSICQPDLSQAMNFGGVTSCPMHNLCINSKLLDTDVAQSGVQASCKVWLSVPPVGSPNGPYTETAPYPQCDDARSVVPCWYLSQDTAKCPVNGQLIGVVRESSESTFNEGTIMNLQCLACPESVTDASTIPGCDYSH
jgi:hypothetical protein